MAATPTEPRLTSQRRVVEEALRASGRAVSAADLYQALRPRNPRLGRATVFRALDVLVDGGRARRFEGEGHVYLYTACDESHHHHLVCRRCGRTTDIEEREIETLVRSVRRRHGFAVDDSALDFYGVCAACAVPTD